MTVAAQSVALWSPKGGVGKSILAAALALKLGEQQRTVLIDGNADNPDVVTLLQCYGHPNVTVWPVRVEPSRVESALVKHSHHLWVLPGPPRYVEADTLTGAIMESILDSCGEAGMTIVVDLGSPLRDSTLAALDRVDLIFVPVTLDLLALSPLKRLSRELELLRFPRSKFRLIVNRLSPSREVTLDDIRTFIDFPVVGVVPSAKELAAAVNRGELGYALGAGTPVGKAIDSIAHPFSLAEVTGAVRTTSRLGGWLLGKGER